MTDNERRAGYVELGVKMDSIDTRMFKVEKDIVDIKATVSNNLMGEHSVWQAIEKLTKSLDESNIKQSQALDKAIANTERAVAESVKDRKELHDLILEQGSNMKLLTSAYQSITGWSKSIIVILVTSVVGILVGLLTHTIKIP